MPTLFNELLAGEGLETGNAVIFMLLSIGLLFQP